MVNREKFSPHLEIILKEMCNRVGADYVKMDFRKPEWFRDYSWTQKEENKFKDWMVTYLYNNFQARKEFMTITRKNKKNCKEAVQMWLFNHGWINKESEKKS